MNFLDKFVSGEYEKALEEKKLVMDKTVSVSTDPGESKVKVDHLDSDNTLEKDVLKQQKAERDVTGTVALPFFRFEEKQKKDIEAILERIIDIGASLLKANEMGVYTPLFGYITVPKKDEIQHLVNLTISRNCELFNTSDKEFEIETITCYYDKKLRMKYNISEDKIIDESVDVEYASAKKVIENTLQKLYDALIGELHLKDSGTEKDIDVYISDSAGDETLGSGSSIFLKYKKLIDYQNKRRGKEDYELFSGILDKEFEKSMENSENTHIKEEQNSINYKFSTEAIADGMSENSESDDDSGSVSENDATDESLEGEDDSKDMDNDGSMDEGDDMGEDASGSEGEEGDDESGGDTNDSGSGSSSSTNDDLKPGQNPFADINSKDRISIELNELKDQIDKVLIKLGQFKSNVVVKKLIELGSHVEDALKNSYIVPMQDSLIRYSLYVSQFEDLISALEKYFAGTKPQSSDSNDSNDA